METGAPRNRLMPTWSGRKPFTLSHG